ncbi:MAG: chromate transporter [Mogibacterium sp.]|nr:chromate transporter [Mogibacterium sp.]
MIYLQLYWAFFKIGLLGFGGGMAIIRLISDSIQQFVAMTPAEFANIVAIAQVTPGPVAVNTATYVGYVSAGVLGSAVATLGVATPAFILVSLACRFINKHRENRTLDAALRGVRPATVGMIAAAFITIGKPAFLTTTRLGSNVPALLAVLPANVDVIAILIAALTVYLIAFKKVKSFRVLIIMGILGAILGA